MESALPVYRSETDNGTFDLIKSNISSLSLQDTNLSCDKTYYYQIVIKDNVPSDASSIISVKSKSEILSPATPSVSNQANGNRITWNSVECGSKYNIYRSTNTSSGFSKIGILNKLYRQFYKQFNNLLLSISGLSSAGEGNQSPNSSAVLTVPEPPSDLDVTVPSSGGSSKIDLNWSPVNTANNYSVYYSTLLNGSYNLSGTTASNNYSVTGLSPNTNYFFKVDASNSGGTGKKSSAENAKTLLQSPSNFKASGLSSSEIQLTWDLYPDATTYKLYRDGAFIGNVNGTDYKDNGLNTASNYNYHYSHSIWCSNRLCIN